MKPVYIYNKGKFDVSATRVAIILGYRLTYEPKGDLEPTVNWLIGEAQKHGIKGNRVYLVCMAALDVAKGANNG